MLRFFSIAIPLKKTERISTGNSPNKAIFFFLIVIPSEECPRDGTSAEILGDDAISFRNPRVLFRGYSHFSSTRSLVAENPELSQFDCGAMADITFYALNQLRQCHITPQELEITRTKIILYTKHYPEELNAKKMSITTPTKNGFVGMNTTAVLVMILLE